MSKLRSRLSKCLWMVALCYQNSLAADETWNGNTSSDLTYFNNWTPATVPGSTDIAHFSTTSGSLSPTVSDGGANNQFSPGEMEFDANGDIYSVNVNGVIASIGFHTVGVTNLSGKNQTFTCLNGTGGVNYNIVFNGGTSADSTSSKLVTYNVQNSSKMIFQLNFSTASSAKFNLINSGNILFTDDSLGGTAIFNLNDSSSIFFIGAAPRSQSATFNLKTSSSLTFGGSGVSGDERTTGFQTTINAFNASSVSYVDNSIPTNAVINLHDTSSLTFNTDGIFGVFPQAGPFITLFNSASMTIVQNIEINRLVSHSSNTVVNLGTQALTIHEPSMEKDTYAGKITGTGQLIINDVDTTASLTLTGVQNPADTWQANVMVGKLIGSSSNLNRNITIGSQGTVVFKQSTNGVFNHSITGTGTLDTKGPGNLTIASNNSTFAGTTNVISGKLILNGRLGGPINVFGTLAGTGIALGTVEVKNGGVISPNGNKIGTLTVGDYINDASAKYLVNVNGSGASDLIDATTVQTNGTGKVTLLGGNVTVAPINDQFLFNFPYTIVTAENGVTGKYSSVISFSPFVRAVLSYDPNDVFVTLKRNFVPFAKTHNQKAVAEQIETISSSSPAFSIVEALLFLTPAQYRAALDELSGEQYTALVPTLQNANQRFIRAINVPIWLNMQDNCEQAPCEREGIWADVQYANSFAQGDDNAKGYKVKTYDGFFATQMKLNPCFTVGLAAYFENDRFDFNLNGNAHMNTALGSLFGVYQGDCFYVLSDLLFGYSFNRVRRNIDFDDFHQSTKADPRIYDAAFYAEVGTNYSLSPCLIIQPFAGVELDYFYLPHFRENGGEVADLKAKNQEYRQADTYLGLRSKATFCGGLEISAEAAWQHRYKNDLNKIKFHFIEFGNEFDIIGPKQGQDGFEGSLLFAINAMDSRKVFAEVYGQRWEHYSEYGFSIGLDFNW